VLAVCWLPLAAPPDYAEATKLSTITPHSNAATPACQHYGTCGGCSLQALEYSAQVAHKVEHVGQIFTRVGQLDAAVVRAAQQPPLAADVVYGYRNKVQLAFSSWVWQPEPLLALQQQQSGPPLPPQQQQQQSGLPPLPPQQLQQQQQVPVPGGLQGSVQQGFGLGYLLPGSNNVVVPIAECLLAVS
jgi:hypothetical protein